MKNPAADPRAFSRPAPKPGKRPTGDKDEKFCKWNTNFLGRSNRENETTFWAVSLFLGIFQLGEPKKRFPFSPEPEFSKFLIKWKAPLVIGPSSRLSRVMNYHFKYPLLVFLSYQHHSHTTQKRDWVPCGVTRYRTRDRQWRIVRGRCVMLWEYFSFL